MKIRKATKKDFEKYFEIVVEKFEDENNKVPSKLSIRKEFDRIMSSKEDILIFYEDGKKILGYLHGKLKRNFWSSGGNIEYLFVSKKHRNNGIATKLIKEFISTIGKRKSFVKVTLMVNLKNKNAKRLYKKLGFETTNYVMRKKLK
jgi:ribosomal protein S18 acetylase RimI-like enzyme